MSDVYHSCLGDLRFGGTIMMGNEMAAIIGYGHNQWMQDTVSIYEIVSNRFNERISL